MREPRDIAIMALSYIIDCIFMREIKKESGYYRGHSPLVERFVHAFRGIGHAWTKEPNFRIQVLISLVVLGAMALLPLTAMERSILIIIIALVLTLETVNSIFERLLDVLHPEYSHEVKRIKDTMAGAVLIASTASVAVAVLIFARHFFAFDIIFQEALVGMRTQTWVGAARLVTTLGDWQVFAVLVVLASLFFLYKKRYMFLGFLLGSVVSGNVVLFALKYILGRERPTGVDLIEASGYSFPSGHVFLATIFWIALAYTLTNQNRERLYLWLLPAILIPLIALSRVVLSVHWFSDIAAGFLFGIFWLLLWWGINKILFRIP